MYNAHSIPYQARKDADKPGRQARYVPQADAKDCGIGRPVEAGVELPEALGRLRIACSVRADQVLRLISEMIEVRVRLSPHLQAES